MEILTEYHQIFMVMSFALLTLTVFTYFWGEKRKEKMIAGLIFNGLNYLISMVTAFGFFGIGLTGYTSSGSPVITAHHEMMSLYVIYLAIFYITLILFYYGLWILIRKPWDDKNVGLV